MPTWWGTPPATHRWGAWLSTVAVDAPVVKVSVSEAGDSPSGMAKDIADKARICCTCLTGELTGTCGTPATGTATDVETGTVVPDT